MYDFESTIPIPFTGSAITSAGEGDFIIFLLHTCTGTRHIIIIIIIVLYAVCFSSASTAPASKQLIIYILTP